MTLLCDGCGKKADYRQYSESAWRCTCKCHRAPR